MMAITIRSISRGRWHLVGVAALSSSARNSEWAVRSLRIERRASLSSYLWVDIASRCRWSATPLTSMQCGECRNAKYDQGNEETRIERHTSWSVCGEASSSSAAPVSWSRETTCLPFHAHDALAHITSFSVESQHVQLNGLEVGLRKRACAPEGANVEVAGRRACTTTVESLSSFHTDLRQRSCHLPENGHTSVSRLW
jgi:hypothetical protein